MTIGFFVCGFHVTFVGLHLPSYIADKAIGMNFLGTPISPLELGGWAIGLVGLFNIAGSLLWGWLGGRYPKKDMLALLYALRAAAFVVFLTLPLSWVSVLLFAATLGFLWLGTVPLTSGLVGYMFGPAHMSMLWGIVFFSHQLGSFFGGWGAGRLYDHQGQLRRDVVDLGRPRRPGRPASLADPRTAGAWYRDGPGTGHDRRRRERRSHGGARPDCRVRLRRYFISSLDCRLRG